MNFKPTRILVPTDESENARLALDKAVAIAQTTGAEIYLLEVVAPLYAAPEYPVEDLVGQMQTRAKKYVSDLVDEIKEASGLTKVIGFVSRDAPKPTIAKTFPEAHQIDLIVMGATGTNAFERAILGSTTGYVVRNSTIDVLVVKNEDAS